MLSNKVDVRKVGQQTSAFLAVNGSHAGPTEGASLAAGSPVDWLRRSRVISLFSRRLVLERVTELLGSFLFLVSVLVVCWCCFSLR